MGFSREEHCSGLPFPCPGDLPDPGTETMSPALAGRFFTIEPPRKPMLHIRDLVKTAIPWGPQVTDPQVS